MSEEVLKALMQLFAIIANQDSGSRALHANYVQLFLRSQISEERIPEFLDYFQSFLKDNKEEDEGQVKRTLMKDSVRTLAICKKINKTLNQKQKIIVFARLIEFVRQDATQSSLRNEILETVAEVFNISKEQHAATVQVYTQQFSELSAEFLVLYHTAIPNANCRQKSIVGFPGSCVFHYVRESNLIFFVYQGETEINLNGLSVKPDQIHVFSPGSSIRHPKGTVFYSDIITSFLDEAFAHNVHLHAEIKTHRHPNGKVALNDIVISEKSGTLFGIMGASGSGKTTLLNVLSGNDRVTDGIIRINGNDISDKKSNTISAIGFIPQDDLLIEELTVYQNLLLSAKLCFDELRDEDLRLRVDKTLQSLGLFEAKDIRVGSPLNKKISGGQRKRLNIALELIREPQILFVDEPTSGLSSKDSENVMDLLKELSQKGKLIFVVIHQPSSDIYKLFDKIFLLDVGGYPVYYNNPVEALIYFKKTTNQINSDIAECHSCGSVNPELVFNLLEAKEIDEYGNYTEKRKINPEGWNKLFKKQFPAEPFNPAQVFEKITSSVIPGKIKQWFIFLQRDFLSKIANRQYILINLLEVPFLALFLSLLIRFINRPSNQTAYSYHHNENIPAFFFMSIIVALLVGLTVSAEEIFKDQKILKREKFLQLSRLSYLLSKILLLFLMAAIQTIFLSLIGYFVLDIPGNPLAFSGMIFSVFCAANLMGLVLSSSFNSPVTIYIIIPLVIIPQMLLGGAMFKYSRLNEWLGGGPNEVPPIANVMVARWAYEGIAVNEYQSNAYEREMFLIDKLESKLNYKVSYAVPKLEELIERAEKRKDELSPAQLKQLQALIAKISNAEFVAAQNDIGKITRSADEDSLTAMKAFLTKKYNFISEKKEAAELALKKKGIVKEKYTNKNLDELMTSSLEKNKISVDTISGQFVQIMDPVFKDPQTSGSGWRSHFYAPYKLFFGQQMSTYTYNLMMIWLLNVFCFLLLYFDVLKSIFVFFGKWKMKTNASS